MLVIMFIVDVDVDVNVEKNCLETKVSWQSRMFSSLKVVDFEVRCALGNVSSRKPVDWESTTGTKEWKSGRFVTSAIELTANVFFRISYNAIGKKFQNVENEEKMK